MDLTLKFIPSKSLFVGLQQNQALLAGQAAKSHLLDSSIAWCCRGSGATEIFNLKYRAWKPHKVKKTIMTLNQPLEVRYNYLPEFLKLNLYLISFCSMDTHMYMYV